jgi:hypothetical protein
MNVIDGESQADHEDAGLGYPLDRKISYCPEHGWQDIAFGNGGDFRIARSNGWIISARVFLNCRKQILQM